MFTGLVLEKGSVHSLLPARLTIGHSAAVGRRLEPGASVAVSGVCLTVVAAAPTRSEFDLSPETMARTTLGSWRAGDEVNLEPALRSGDPLGGHWVQGHVDGTTEVLAVAGRDGHREVRFALDRAWRGLVAEKGSIAIDGVSLTVAGVEDDAFRAALVPHTLAVTTLGGLAAGRHVNVELDILAKYVERQLATRGLGGPAA